MKGRYVSVVPLEAERHGPDLWDALGGLEHAALWDWLAGGPFAERPPFDEQLLAKQTSKDRTYFALLDTSGCAQGHACYLRDDKDNRVIEVGDILYGPALQRTCAATEAMYLMARNVFEEMRYRRYEWKCNALNHPSRRAAERLGFTYEGTFRQHMIVKDANRDTAWFSMLDSEWPARKAAFEAWLDPSNFDENGRQRSPLNR